jgi:hypothetical protein
MRHPPRPQNNLRARSVRLRRNALGSRERLPLTRRSELIGHKEDRAPTRPPEPQFPHSRAGTVHDLPAHTHGCA